MAFGSRGLLDVKMSLLTWLIIGMVGFFIIAYFAFSMMQYITQNMNVTVA